MRRPAIFFILLALFLAAIATRVATRDRLETPYFKGESAMVYAHALAAADGVPLDTISVQANYPAGYTPARYRADGFERAWAVTYRGARFVSEVDARDFARRTIVFLAAMCVFTMYSLSRRLWHCQATGLLAAFLVAFLSPFVLATNGRVFTHTTLVPLFVSAHAALALSALATETRRGAVLRVAGATMAALVLLVSWEAGLYILAIWSVTLALATRDNGSRFARVSLLAGHAIAIIAACLTSPHLIATRAMGSWAAVFVLASAILPWAPVGVLPSRYHRRLVRLALVLGAAAVLWIVTTPFRAGATEQFPSLLYLVTRAQHLFGKPEASALSSWTRHLWSFDHAPLAPYIVIELLLPVSLLTAAFALNPELRARGRTFLGAVLLLLVATVATIVDRSILPVASIAMIAVASGAGHLFSHDPRKRAPLVILGALVAITSVVFRGGAVDAPYQIAKAAGVANRDPSSFLWVSFENTDRELVRFVATRTSVRESILAPDDLSALLLAFTGRNVTALPGATSRAPAERHVSLTRALYGTEEELFEVCRDARIDYVVYSIDVLLDTGRYSPRYLAAAGPIAPESIAFKMHFDPESLRRFTLLYENDHYRLFEVTGTPQPIFATDHPPFYQTELLATANRDVEAFRKLAVEVMLTYAEAVKARAHGNAEGALRRLEWCLLQAPRYSQARIALADALMDLDRYEDAHRVVVKLVEYAPDNTRGLYYAAYTSAQLERFDEAKNYLTLLLSIERDPDGIERARALEAAVDQGLKPRPGAPQEG